MGIFGEMSYGELRPTPIGLPVEDLKLANQQLEGQYLTNRENGNRLQVAVANLQVLNPDEHFKTEVLDKVKNSLMQTVERNDWEYAAPVVSDAAKTVDTDKGLKAAQAVKAYRDKWLTDAEGMAKEGKYDVSDVNKAQAINDDLYKGVQLDENGNAVGSWGALDVAEMPDWIEIDAKLGANWASDKHPVSFDSNGVPMEAWKENGKTYMRQAGSMYLQTMEVEEVKEEDLANFYLAALGSDPKIQHYLDFKNSVSNYDNFGHIDLSRVDMNAANKVYSTPDNPISNGTVVRHLLAQEMAKNLPNYYKYDNATGNLLSPEFEETTLADGTIQRTMKTTTDEKGNIIPVYSTAKDESGNLLYVNDPNIDPSYLVNTYLGYKKDNYISTRAGMFAEKYGFEKYTPNYLVDIAAKAQLEASLAWANKKRELDYQKQLDNEGVTFNTVEAGDELKYTDPNSIDMEMRMLRLTPGFNNSSEMQKEYAALEDKKNMMIEMKKNAYRDTYDKYSPEAANKFVEDIKRAKASGKLNGWNPEYKRLLTAYRFVGGGNGSVEAFEKFVRDIDNINMETLKTNFAISYAEQGRYNNSAISGYLTPDEQSAWDDDTYFGTTSFGNVGNTIFGAIGDFYGTLSDMNLALPIKAPGAQTEAGNKRTLVNEYYNDHPVSGQVSLTTTTFMNKDVQANYDRNMRTALDVQGHVIMGKGVDSPTLQAYLEDEKIKLDPITGEYIIGDGKDGNKGTYRVVAGTMGGHNVQVVTIGDKTITVSTPGDYVGTNFSHGSIVTANGLAKNQNEVAGWSDADYMGVSGAYDYIEYPDGTREAAPANIYSNGGSAIINDNAAKRKNAIDAANMQKLQTWHNNKTVPVVLTGGTKKVTIQGFTTGSGAIYRATVGSGSNSMTFVTIGKDALKRAYTNANVQSE